MVRHKEKGLSKAAKILSSKNSTKDQKSKAGKKLVNHKIAKH